MGLLVHIYVLADVQRELEIKNESAIVTPSKYERKELNFEIIEVPEPDYSEGEKNLNIKKLVAEQKRSKLNSFLSLLPTRDWGKSKSFDDLDSFFSSDQNYQNSGIVFCPHKNWVFGASDNCDEIRNSFPELIGKTDFYHGGETDRKDDEKNFDEVQDKLKIIN